MIDPVSAPWSVQDAKAQLSELLRRARKGEPQLIGTRDSCVVISEAAWRAAQGASLGQWLIESAPSGAAVELPSRKSRRVVDLGDDDP
jgi:prevent-host-death family protein